MRDMRNTPSGNPTVTENYDDTAEQEPRLKAVWVSEKALHIYDKGMLIWHGEVNSSTKNLIEALGVTVPENPHILPVTTLILWEVTQATDEHRSTSIGHFWNKKDADKFAKDNPGWFDVPSRVERIHLKVLGQR